MHTTSTLTRTWYYEVFVFSSLSCGFLFSFFVTSICCTYDCCCTYEIQSPGVQLTFVIQHRPNSQQRTKDPIIFLLVFFSFRPLFCLRSHSTFGFRHHPSCHTSTYSTSTAYHHPHLHFCSSLFVSQGACPCVVAHVILAGVFACSTACCVCGCMRTTAAAAQHQHSQKASSKKSSRGVIDGLIKD